VDAQLSPVAASYYPSEPFALPATVITSCSRAFSAPNACSVIRALVSTNADSNAFSVATTFLRTFANSLAFANTSSHNTFALARSFAKPELRAYRLPFPRANGSTVKPAICASYVAAHCAAHAGSILDANSFAHNAPICIANPGTLAPTVFRAHI
jgi:hypothetical protein